MKNLQKILDHFLRDIAGMCHTETQTEERHSQQQQQQKKERETEETWK